MRSVFVEQLYYDGKFKGTLYMKEIALILCPEISYDNLNIKSGLQAQYEYKRLQTNPEKHSFIKEDLYKYSHMDSYSLMKVLEFLKAVSKA